MRRDTTGVKSDIATCLFENHGDDEATIEAIYDLINPETLERKQAHIRSRAQCRAAVAALLPDSPERWEDCVDEMMNAIDI